MGRLLHFETRKLFRQTSFYVCLAVLLALVFVGIFSTYSLLRIAQSELGVEMNLADLALFTDSQLNARGYLFSALSGNNFLLLAGIFTALFICSDYVGGTAKNVIGRGFSRASYLNAKLLVCEGGILLYAVCCCAFSFLMATLYFGAGKNWEVRDLVQLLIQFLIVLAYGAFFSFLSLLTKKSGASLALNIMAPVVISTVLGLVDIFVEKKEIAFSDYWLAGCLTKASNLSTESGDLMQCGIVAAVYLIVFVLLSHLLVRRQDV